MSVIDHLKDNSNKFSKLYLNSEDFTYENISLVDVYASTIVTQCISIYERKFSWIRLIIRSTLAINRLILYIIIKLLKIIIDKKKLKKENNQNINGTTVFFINTNLAKRELYRPLVDASANSKMIINYFCIRAAEKDGTEIEADKSFTFFLYHTYKIIKLLLIHLSYLFKTSPRQSFLLIYSFMANIQAIIEAMEVINHCIIHNIRPNNFVYDDINDPATRIVALYFKKVGIHINVLQFGHYEKESVEWNYVIADTLYVWGEYYERLFVNEHNLPININVKKIGSPRFDYIFEQRKAAVNLQNIVNKDTKYGLLFSTYSISNYEKWVENAIISKIKHEVVEEFSKIKSQNTILLIKPHPYESNLDIAEWNKMANQKVQILDHKIDVRNLIANASFVITFGSGLTLDALVANKVVLIPNWYKTFPWEIKLLGAAGAQLLESKTELNSRIIRSISDDVVEQNENILNFVSNNKCVSIEILKEFLH